MKYVIHKRKNTIWFNLYKVPRVVKFTEAEKKVQCGFPRAEWRGEKGKLLFSGCRVSVWENEKLWRRTAVIVTMCMYLLMLSHTLISGKSYICVFCLLYSKTSFLGTSLRFTTKLRGEYRISHVSPAPTHASPHPSSTLLITVVHFSFYQG